MHSKTETSSKPDVSKRRLFYISPRDMRKNRADPVHMMKSCDAFAADGWNVYLVAPYVYRREWKTSRKGIFTLYGMKPSFRIIELPTPLHDDWSGWFPRIVKFIAFGIFYLMMIPRLGRTTVIYSKCYISIIPAILLKSIRLIGADLFFEKAEFNEDNKVHRYVAKNVDGLVVINEFIRTGCIENYGLTTKQVIRLPFASMFNEVSALKIALRSEPHELFRVTFAGKIFSDSREVTYILEAAELLVGEKVEFIFVGGKETVVEEFRSVVVSKNIGPVLFTGFVTLEEYFRYVLSADLLISYYDSFDKLSVTQRGPAKMSIYPVAGKPIILADLPSMRELCTDDQVYFVPPDEPAALADMISHIIHNPEEAAKKAARFKEYARINTYFSSYQTVGTFLRSNHR